MRATLSASARGTARTVRGREHRARTLRRYGMLVAMLTPTASVRFTIWANAVLTQHTDPDTAAERIRGDDVGHLVGGLPGQDGMVTLPIALHLLRRYDTVAVSLALPSPGDPLGLAGPRDFTEAATAAGQAVVCHTGTSGGLGLVPVQVGPAVQWLGHTANAPRVDDLAQADRDLRAGLLEAAEELAALDLARWRPELADELIDIRAIGTGRDDSLAPGYPPRAAQLSARARRLLAVAEAALRDDGNAVTRGQADDRRQAVGRLAAVARRALVAACSCVPAPA